MNTNQSFPKELAAVMLRGTPVVPGLAFGPSIHVLLHGRAEAAVPHQRSRRGLSCWRPQPCRARRGAARARNHAAVDGAIGGPGRRSAARPGLTGPVPACGRCRPGRHQPGRGSRRGTARCWL